MTKAEREAAAVARYDCPLRFSCGSDSGEQCQRSSGFQIRPPRYLKHPHAQRMALVTEESK